MGGMECGPLYVSDWLVSAELSLPGPQETKERGFQEWLELGRLSEVMEQSEDKQPPWPY